TRLLRGKRYGFHLTEARSKGSELCFGIDERRAVRHVTHHSVQLGHRATRIRHGAGSPGKTVQIEGDDAHGDVVRFGELCELDELSPGGSTVADPDTQGRIVDDHLVRPCQPLTSHAVADA